MNDTLRRLHEIGYDLHLAPVSQEWGIENADQTRIAEFIDYFYSAQSEPKTVRYNLVDLVAASIWKAQEDSVKYDYEKVKVFYKIIEQDSYFDPLVIYWQSLGLFKVKED